MVRLDSAYRPELVVVRLTDVTIRRFVALNMHFAVAGVAHVIAVLIVLIRVVNANTVVAGITDSVFILIVLIEVDDERAVILLV